MMKMRLFAPAAFLALIAAATLAAEPVRDAWARVEAGDDPSALVDLRLARVLTPEIWAREFDAAVAAEGEDLAASFIELARERGLAIDSERLARAAALNVADWTRSARRFTDGFLHGAGDSDAAFSGALAADVTGFGDLRDLAGEGRKLAAGQEPDALVIGLSAAGLALSAAAFATWGAAMPARGGLTFVKGAYRAGRLSKPLAATLTRSVAAALDREALQASVQAASRLQISTASASAARILRPAAMTELRMLGAQTSSIARHAGGRGLRQVLATAENAGEIGRAAQLAARKGAKTRAILKVLGRGALIAASLSFSVFGWLSAFVFYLFSLALLARRFGSWIGRLIWRRASRETGGRRSFRKKRPAFDVGPDSVAATPATR